MRNLLSRLSRLEARASVIGPVGSFSARVMLVDPVDGPTGLADRNGQADYVDTTDRRAKRIRLGTNQTFQSGVIT